MGAVIGKGAFMFDVDAKRNPSSDARDMVEGRGYVEARPRRKV
jgi:hypothetical protein